LFYFYFYWIVFKMAEGGKEIEDIGGEDIIEGGKDRVWTRRDASLCIQHEVQTFLNARTRAESAPEVYPSLVVDCLDSTEAIQRYRLWCIVS
jgi:hypothetical protein